MRNDIQVGKFFWSSNRNKMHSTTREHGWSPAMDDTYVKIVMTNERTVRGIPMYNGAGEWTQMSSSPYYWSPEDVRVLDALPDG